MHIEDKDLVPELSGQPGGPALRAAVYARVDTALGFTRWLGLPGNYLIARPAARVAASHQSEETGLPLDAAVVLGLGDDALHVWKADPALSRVTDHLGSVELARITDMHVEIAKSWHPLKIEFEGGEAAELQARGDVSGFVRQFQAGTP